MPVMLCHYHPSKLFVHRRQGSMKFIEVLMLANHSPKTMTAGKKSEITHRRESRPILLFEEPEQFVSYVC